MQGTRAGLGPTWRRPQRASPQAPKFVPTLPPRLISTSPFCTCRELFKASDSEKGVPKRLPGREPVLKRNPVFRFHFLLRRPWGVAQEQKRPVSGLLPSSAAPLGLAGPHSGSAVLKVAPSSVPAPGRAESRGSEPCRVGGLLPLNPRPPARGLSPTRVPCRCPSTPCGWGTASRPCGRRSGMRRRRRRRTSPCHPRPRRRSTPGSRLPLVESSWKRAGGRRLQ